MAATLFRGALPSPRYRLAAAQPHIISGLTPSHLLYKPARLSWWVNNEHRDCVTAEEAFAKACHTPELFISDEAVLNWATQHNFLNGAILVDVLDLMVNNGFRQDGHTYGNGPHIAVDWTNAAIVQNAIAHGPVKVGVAANQLERAWRMKNDQTPDNPLNGWLATGFRQEDADNHCASLCGYGSFGWLAEQLGVQLPDTIDVRTPGYGIFTWDSIGVIDHQSMVSITHEAWLRNPTTIIK